MRLERVSQRLRGILKRKKAKFYIPQENNRLSGQDAQEIYNWAYFYCMIERKNEPMTVEIDLSGLALSDGNLQIDVEI